MISPITGSVSVVAVSAVEVAVSVVACEVCSVEDEAAFDAQPARDAVMDSASIPAKNLFICVPPMY